MKIKTIIDSKRMAEMEIMTGTEIKVNKDDHEYKKERDGD